MTDEDNMTAEDAAPPSPRFKNPALALVPKNLIPENVKEDEIWGDAVETEDLAMGMIVYPSRRTEEEERQFERDIKARDYKTFRRAAELCGVSTREIIRRGKAACVRLLLAKYDALQLTRPESLEMVRRGAVIYARLLLAKYDAPPLTRPEP